MPADIDIGGTSEDAVLGGRLRLRQPLRGHRVGHDAMLLAAATAALAGEHAVDLGAGIGSAGLALARRVDGVTVTLVEIDPALTALATGNAALNGLDGRVRAITADVEAVEALAAAGLGAASADHVLMNPPFNDARSLNVSPDPRRRLAHVAAPGLLGRWVASAGWLLKPGGVLTLVWRAEELDGVRAALATSFGDVAVRPVQPRLGGNPIRVLVRAVKDGGDGWRECLPLVLNGVDGKPSAAAEAVLRFGEPLGFDD
ncbi:MAG: methyltransferase [Pseudolabrys sp.]|nr:methyltransferase [Pseudolabrys sp.]